MSCSCSKNQVAYKYHKRVIPDEEVIESFIERERSLMGEMIDDNTNIYTLYDKKIKLFQRIT